LISSPASSADAESAIANLDASYAEIFSSLHITVSILQRWSREDVDNNLGDGRWWRAGDVHDADFPNAISRIEKALAGRRTYILSTSITWLKRVPSVQTIWSVFTMNSERTMLIIVTLGSMTAFISKRRATLMNPL